MWDYYTNPKPGTVFRPLSHLPKKIPVQYWEEIKPGDAVPYNHVPFLMEGIPIIREGDRVFMVHQI